ncbi:MAG TPA: glycoside hydrolase family 1 protein [Polyangiaceae bacterium]
MLAIAGVVSLVEVGCKSSAAAPAATDGGATDGATVQPGDGSVDAEAGTPLPSEVTFPAGFLWGTATAAFQVEKGDSNTDWAHWVATPGKITNGDNPDDGGADALDHVDDDIALMKSEGLNAYRFSIELSRVYPTEAALLADQPDAAGVAAYDNLVTKLVAAHITPVVTLSHFALPTWLDDTTQPTQPQGWENTKTGDEFVTFCTKAAARWGDKIDWWLTVNEPINVGLGGYVQASFPPGVALDIPRAFAVARGEARAHARCFDAIHAADTTDADGDGKAALVSYAAHMRTFHPLDPTDPDDQAAAARVRYIANDWFINAVVRGDWDDDFNGDYTGPNDVQADPNLKGRADYLGVNYYSDTLISSSYGLVLPVVNASVLQANLPTDRPKTDFGWDIYPEGFGTVLDEAAGYGLPILVTENGIADRNDVMRGRFLAEHLLQLGAANLRGDRVIGYLHWSMLDNFEWNSGFCPKFGLHAVDRTTAARTARASASLYSSIIDAGKLTQAQIDALPPYGAPTPCN